MGLPPDLSPNAMQNFSYNGNNNKNNDDIESHLFKTCYDGPSSQSDIKNSHMGRVSAHPISVGRNATS